MTVKANATLFLSLLLVIGITGCKKNSFNVDISGIKYNLTIRDLGADIFNLSPPEVAAAVEPLKAEYGDILQSYSLALGLGDPSSPQWNKAFVTYATDLNNAEVWDEVRKQWPSTEPLRAELEKAFRHYLYYFPDKKVPRIVTCITSFNNSLIVSDSLILISLDRYLGSKCKYYPSMGFYEYQARRMTPAYTVTDCLYGWASTEWDYNYMAYGQKNLLSSILHEGKLAYMLHCMVPEASDTLIFGYSKKQLEFCQDNEKRMWDYLVSHDMLFSTDGFLIRKFTGESPFTSYFTEESPGKAVVWNGYRIIASYMRNNPKVSLEEMMSLTDCQAILSGARYRPR
ncbi:MAG TPA: hypothetical protein PKH02_09385 [Bacteroidales bacterium]|nr:hypothetical protein [Bacteroidales bacterium]HPT12450.1 hypothetical protein [Bacteroidales bacterium]